MTKTTNYQLNQWEKTDRILMEEFNSDNEKIDTALKALKDDMVALTAAVALCGNCKIVYGSYKGTGTNGSANPNKLSFSHKPIFVLVQGAASELETDKKLRMMLGVPWAAGVNGNNLWKNVVTWTEKGVQWYSSNSAITQFNISGSTYCYMALLAQDE